ncbi:Autophagy-related protein [Senna tora]|uniref:Autophagy-related protein n=1 Tax=Senna tora TaxID=362788 RepID=A0A835CDA7_9FABA|nr:Autophagy-related protein [Senna tora]
MKKDKSKKANPITLKKDESKKAKPTTLNKEIAPVEMHKEVKQKEPMVLKELSPYMTIVVHHLYKEGYFNFANFAKGERFDLSWFDTEYARKYILFAVQKFGKDKQEISKWLSGSDLKQVAMFGCPSFNRSIVIPSKRLRNFFSIPENTVCSKCVLRESCTFVNQSVWGSDTNKLDLAIVMKVICSYALFVDPELVVPDELKNSVNRLLMEVLKLSKTV